MFFQISVTPKLKAVSELQHPRYLYLCVRNMDLWDGGVVICIQESSGLQNPRVAIILKALKSAFVFLMANLKHDKGRSETGPGELFNV